MTTERLGDMTSNFDQTHCVQSARIWSYSGSYFLAFGLILRISSYLVQMEKNTDQNNSEYGHFSRSATQCLKGFPWAKTESISQGWLMVKPKNPRKRPKNDQKHNILPLKHYFYSFQDFSYYQF